MIISCENCQIYEDQEIIHGIGQPVLLHQLLSSSQQIFCPNCRAELYEESLVYTNIDYVNSWVCEQVVSFAA